MPSWEDCSLKLAPKWSFLVLRNQTLHILRGTLILAESQDPRSQCPRVWPYGWVIRLGNASAMVISISFPCSATHTHTPRSQHSQLLPSNDIITQGCLGALQHLLFSREKGARYIFFRISASHVAIKIIRSSQKVFKHQEATSERLKDWLTGEGGFAFSHVHRT